MLICGRDDSRKIPGPLNQEIVMQGGPRPTEMRLQLVVGFQAEEDAEHGGRRAVVSAVGTSHVQGIDKSLRDVLCALRGLAAGLRACVFLCT